MLPLKHHTRISTHVKQLLSVLTITTPQQSSAPQRAKLHKKQKAGIMRTIAISVGQPQVQLRNLVHLVHWQARNAMLFSVAIRGDKRLQAADLGRSEARRRDARRVRTACLAAHQRGWRHARKAPVVQQERCHLRNNSHARSPQCSLCRALGWEPEEVCHDYGQCLG